MYCIYNDTCGKLCSHFVMTTEVAFTDGNLVLTLPADVTYTNLEKFCIVVGQTIPNEVTRNAPVVAVIKGSTAQFPLVNRNGVPVTQRQIATRKKYPVLVRTSTTSGTLIVLRNLDPADITTLASLNAVAALAEGGDGA